MRTHVWGPLVFAGRVRIAVFPGEHGRGAGGLAVVREPARLLSATTMDALLGREVKRPDRFRIGPAQSGVTVAGRVPDEGHGAGRERSPGDPAAPWIRWGGSGGGPG